MTTDRDQQVAAALDLIDAEPPRPGFWDELEARLHDEPAPAVLLRRVPGAEAARRAAVARRRRVGALVAACLVVAGAIGVRALGDDPFHETVPAGPVDPSTPPGPGDGVGTPTLDPKGPQEKAIGHLDGWLRSVVEGDTTNGWDLLGPQSQESLGTPAAYAAALEDLRATWAPSADAPDRQETVAQLGDTDAWFVVLRHSTGAPDPMGVIVRLGEPAGDTAVVEPFVPGPALDLIEVAGAGQADGAVGPGDVVPLHLDAGAQVAVVLDDLVVGEAWLVRAADGAVTGLRLPADATTGLHSVAVAEQLPGGSIAADARAVRVSGG